MNFSAAFTVGFLSSLVYCEVSALLCPSTTCGNSTSISKRIRFMLQR